MVTGARLLDTFDSDLQEMKSLVANSSTDLFSPLPHGSGQTILREALLLADHNAYHLGQLVTIRRLLGDWKVVRTWSGTKSSPI